MKLGSDRIKIVAGLRISECIQPFNQMTAMKRSKPSLILRLLAAAFVALASQPAFAEIEDEIIEFEKRLNSANQAGRYKEAEQIGKQMLAVARSSPYSDDPTNEAAALSDLAGVYVETRRYPE